MSENTGNLGKAGKDSGKDVQEIIIETRKKKGPVHEILERERDSMIEELETSKIQRMLEEERQKILMMRQGNQPLPQGQAQGFAQMLFQGRKPGEVKEILDSLDEQNIEKLALISSTMNNNQFGAVTQLLNRPDRSIKDTIELANMIIKMNQKPPEQSGITLQGIAALMKEVRESQTPPQATQQNTVETLKTYHDMFLKPVLDQLASKDRENLEMRMRHMESQRIDPLEYLKSIKQASSDLGLSQTARSDIDMKLEEMRETHDVEMAKLGFETRKWEHQKDGEGKTIEQVKDLVKVVTEGPVGKALEALGEAGADKIRGSSKRDTSHIIQVSCPNCGGKFQANDQLAMINCPLCGAQLARATPPAPQSSPPTQMMQSEQKTQETQTTVNPASEGQPQSDNAPAQ